VHPFWPFDSSWYYGDTIFIIEPWFWVTTLPALAYLAHSKVARFILLLLSAGMLVLVWLVPMVQAWSAAAVTLATLAALAALRRRSPAARVGFALVSSLLVLVTFATLSRMARASAQGATRAHFAPTALLDVALTPAPASPLCFSAIVLTLEGDAYVTRTATIAPLPSLMDPRACRSMYVGETARLAPAELEARAHGTLFRGELRARAHELGALAAADCRVRAFLRFARAPFWRREEVADNVGAARVPEGNDRTTRLVLGDLRYDRDVSLGFAELALEPLEPEDARAGDAAFRCPRFVPPWAAPRSDVTERMRAPAPPSPRE
jgi:inner membrane protein